MAAAAAAAGPAAACSRSYPAHELPLLEVGAELC